MTYIYIYIYIFIEFIRLPEAKCRHIRFTHTHIHRRAPGANHTDNKIRVHGWGLQSPQRGACDRSMLMMEDLIEAKIIARTHFEVHLGYLI